MDWMYIFAYFIVYSFLGWICEDIYCGIGKRKFINRGFLYGPYCPIYGFGALLVIYPLLAIGNHPVYVFVAGMLLTSLLEYGTSYVMERLFSTRWWDYSSYPFNICGRVCLQNSLLFGLLSIIVVYGVHPLICDFVFQLNPTFLFFFELIFLLGFLMDLIMTITTLMQRKHLLDTLHNDIESLIAQFEMEKEEFNGHLEQWLSEKKDILDVTAIKERMAGMERIKKKHVMKAFPDCRLANRLQKLEDIGSKVKKHER